MAERSLRGSFTSCVYGKRCSSWGIVQSTGCNDRCPLVIVTIAVESSYCNDCSKMTNRGPNTEPLDAIILILSALNIVSRSWRLTWSGEHQGESVIVWTACREWWVPNMMFLHYWVGCFKSIELKSKKVDQLFKAPSRDGHLQCSWEYSSGVQW